MFVVLVLVECCWLIGIDGVLLLVCGMMLGEWFNLISVMDWCYGKVFVEGC